MVGGLPGPPVSDGAAHPLGPPTVHPACTRTQRHMCPVDAAPSPARRGRSRRHAWVERTRSQRTRGAHRVCGASVTARDQQDSLGWRTESRPWGQWGAAARGGSLGAGSSCPHPSAGCSRRPACVVTGACASRPLSCGFSLLFFQCKEPRQGKVAAGGLGQQQGGPDHCPSQSSPAALTWPVTTSLAIVSQPRPEKDFPSSTQQSHFRLKELPRPCILWCAGAGRTPRMWHSRLEAAHPTGEAGGTSSHGPAEQTEAGLPGLIGPSASPHGRPRLPLRSGPRSISRGVSTVQWCLLPNTPHTHTSWLGSLLLARRPPPNTHTATRLAAQTSACIPGCVRACLGSGQRPSDRETSSQDWLLEVFPEFWVPPSSVSSHRGSSEGLEPPGVDGPLWAAFPRPAVSPERPPL